VCRRLWVSWHNRELSCCIPLPIVEENTFFLFSFFFHGKNNILY
jgi:hypothetical protein